MLVVSGAARFQRTLWCNVLLLPTNMLLQISCCIPVTSISAHIMLFLPLYIAGTHPQHMDTIKIRFMVAGLAARGVLCSSTRLTMVCSMSRIALDSLDMWHAL